MCLFNDKAASRKPRKTINISAQQTIHKFIKKRLKTKSFIISMPSLTNLKKNIRLKFSKFRKNCQKDHKFIIVVKQIG